MRIGSNLRVASAIGAILFSNIISASIVRLTSYAQLVEALKNGHRVNSVTEFKKCQLTGDTRAIKDSEDVFESMGMSFNQGFFLIHKLKGETRFSVGSIATNTIPGKVEGTSNRYKLIRVFDDNTATVSSILSNAVTSKSLGWMEFTCKISQGNDEHGVSLFDYDV